MTSAERAEAGRAIARDAFGAVARFRGGAAGTLALYAPKGSEVETSTLDAMARGAGWHVAYPRVVDGERMLAFHSAAIGELAVGRFGLREPVIGAPRVDLATIDAFIVPGLAFDLHGGRIGWGHGYYDATLAAAPQALRVAIAFGCQLVEEVPGEPHDARMHVIVTERGLVEVARG